MTTVPPPLQGTTKSLAQTYDVALLDLDGVVYVGRHAVEGIPAALAAARRLGLRLAFVTNNAARPPAVVAEHLTALGIAAEPDEVINSAQAAAHYLADRLAAGAKVLVVGTTGLHEALLERGLAPVYSADDQPEAVVQGYSPDLDWRQLAEGAVAIRRGVLWVATNLDATVPSARGPLPGNGSLVAALRHATGVEPVATGKPDPTMHLESVQRSGAKRPIVVGDRLDTDIEGANAAGCPSLLVLSGVTGAPELLAAGPSLRPTYLARDASGLLVAHDEPTWSDGVTRCGAWSAHRAQDGSMVLAHDGSTTPAAGDGLDPLRVLCRLAWNMADSAEQPPGAVAAVHPADAVATDAARHLGLAG